MRASGAPSGTIAIRTIAVQDAHAEKKRPA
jgi:hypothetical protein